MERPFGCIRLRRREIAEMTGGAILASAAIVVLGGPEATTKAALAEVNKTDAVGFKNTVIETGGYILSQFGLGAAADHFKIPQSQVSDQLVEELQSNPLKVIREGSLQNPLTEELRFRFVPSLLLSKFTTDTSWIAGIGTSLWFAREHNPSNGWKQGIPLSQFVGGMWFWRLMRTRGLLNSYLSHGLANLIVLGIGASIISQEKALTQPASR